MIVDYANVSIRRGASTILTDVTFSIDAGEFVYLTGVVGSGKTSLLKTIYAELDIADGKAEVLGTDLTHLRRRAVPALRKQLGIVFQDFRLLTDRTVEGNLDFVLRATGWKKKADRQARIIEVLKTVQLDDKLNAMPYELSGGEQQRVSIARAILNSPKLILADEATGNQDAESGIHTTQILYELAQQGTAVIMATHNNQLIDQFPGIVYECSGHTVRRVATTPVRPAAAMAAPAAPDTDIPTAIIAEAGPAEVQ